MGRSDKCIDCEIPLTDENCTQGAMYCDPCEAKIHQRRICPECETEHDMKDCPECDCARRFTELENKSIILSDRLSDALSELSIAKRSIQNYEDAVDEARKKCNQNDKALRDFKWWTHDREKELLNPISTIQEGDKTDDTLQHLQS